MTTTRQTIYLSVAETAKFVRKALKEAFPGQKFSVKSRTYSGGGSIDVDWEDGPTVREVDPIVKQYEGGGFDGMIDMAYHQTHYLKPDGSVYIHHNPGTEGSTGLVPREDNRGLEKLLPDDVKVVQFGANFIFAHRDRSNYDQRIADADDWCYEHLHIDYKDEAGILRNPHLDRFGNDYVDMVSRALVLGGKVDESLDDAFDRIFRGGDRWA